MTFHFMEEFPWKETLRISIKTLPLPETVDEDVDGSAVMLGALRVCIRYSLFFSRNE